MKLLKNITRRTFACFAVLFGFNAFAANTNLNVAVIYTQDFKNEIEKTTTVENYINGMISTTNKIYASSLFDVKLHTALISPVVSSKDAELDVNNIVDIMKNYKEKYFDLVDYSHQDAIINYVYNHGKIHQVILLLKPIHRSSDCGVASAPRGGIGIFSVVVPWCKDNLTLAHEVAHNMGAVHAKGIYDSEHNWRSLMNTGGNPTENNSRRYITNPDLYAEDCGRLLWRNACGSAGDYDNAHDMTNNLPLVFDNYCTLDIDTQNVSCPNIPINPKPETPTFTRYEAGNCSGSTRLGEVTWRSATHASSYQVQFKSGTSWYNLYEGSNLRADYNTSATGKTHNFRIMAKNSSQTSDWQYFNGFVSSCRNGGGAFAN